jgi:hypothetical protein
MDKEKEFLDFIYQKLMGSKDNFIIFKNSEIQQEPIKSLISHWETIGVVGTGGYTGILPNNSVSPMLPKYDNAYERDFRHCNDCEIEQIKKYRKNKMEELENELDKYDFLVTLWFNREKVCELYEKYNKTPIENLGVEFNGRTISYGNKIYSPDLSKQCLIDYLWEKRYIDGNNSIRGQDFGQTIPDECGIKNTAKAVESFNHATRAKKIPLKLCQNGKKFYLKETRKNKEVMD